MNENVVRGKKRQREYNTYPAETRSECICDYHTSYLVKLNRVIYLFWKTSCNKFRGIAFDNCCILQIGYFAVDERNLDISPLDGIFVYKAEEGNWDEYPNNMFTSQYFLSYFGLTIDIDNIVQRRLVPLKNGIPEFDEKFLLLCHDYLRIIHDYRDKLPTSFFIGSFKDLKIHQGLKVGRNRIASGLFSSNPSDGDYKGCMCSIIPKCTFCGNDRDGVPNGFGSLISANSRYFGTFTHGYQCFGDRVINQDQALSLWNSPDITITIELLHNMQHTISYIKNHRKMYISLITPVSGASIMQKMLQGNRRLVLLYATNATIYNGFSINNIYFGYGEMSYQNQTYYEGCWAETQYNGFGILFIRHPFHGVKYFLKKWSHLGTQISIFPPDRNQITNEVLSTCQEHNLYKAENKEAFRKNVNDLISFYLYSTQRVKERKSINKDSRNVPASERNESPEL